LKVVDDGGKRRQRPRLRRAARGQARQRGPGTALPSWRMGGAVTAGYVPGYALLKG